MYHIEWNSACVYIGEYSKCWRLQLSKNKCGSVREKLNEQSVAQLLLPCDIVVCVIVHCCYVAIMIVFGLVRYEPGLLWNTALCSQLSGCLLKRKKENEEMKLRSRKD